VAGRASGWNSVHGKIFTIVAVCLLSAVAESVIALTSLASVNSNVVTLNQRSVKPLAALGDLRDMEGDTRVLVWKYAAAGSSDRADLRTEISESDAQADQDIADYLLAHGSRTDSRGTLMAQFVPTLQRYRQVRDQQVLTAADSGDSIAAYTALRGPLDAANEAMAEPLDGVFTQEVAAAAAGQRRASHAYLMARIGVGVILLLGLLLATVAAWWFAHGMLAVIGRIRDVMASGSREGRVGVTGDRGELGELGTAIDVMLDSLSAQDADLATEQAATQEHLRAAYIRQQLAEQEVRRRAQSVIDETASTVVAELQDVVAQAEAVLLSAATIDERLSAADQVTRSVVERAKEADRVVAAVGESLKRVGGIAKLIAGVTEQTNLLALNATIEAARAGEAGRGFSVVAAEVKDLAAQTARSTSEITATVENLENDAAAMSIAITDMADGVKGIDDATARVSEVAGEQKTSVEQLDTSVRAALERIRAMSQLTDGLERRHQERVSAHGILQVRFGGDTFTSNLRDISEGGLRCSDDLIRKVPIRSRIQIELRLDDQNKWLNAIVVRKAESEDGGELGVEFEPYLLDELAFVRRFIDAVAGLHATA
jgi:methyl-accepting chemotaxis protein